jgi:alpha-1,2-mannosyltransferase
VKLPTPKRKSDPPPAQAAAPEQLAAEAPPPAEPASATPDEPGDETRRAHRLAVRNAATITAVSVATFGVLLFQSLLHRHLGGIDEYDDGVYFASALQLVHGLLPYHGFAFIQPPMVSVWLSPFAALSAATGTASALEAARIAIDVLAAVNVAMVGLLVRRRPTLQVLVTTGAMAAFPGTVRSAQTVLLEPMLVFLCLAGLLFLFEGGRISRSRRRALIGGVLFGVAGATKLWAAFPFIVVAIVAWRAGPRVCLAWIAGGAAGFVACALPFLVASPGGFVRQVILTQAARNAGGYGSAKRLANLTGLPGTVSAVSHPGTSATQLLCGLFLLLALLCLGAYTRPGRPSLDSVEFFALLAALVTGAGLFFAPVFYYHYPGFEAPFVALLYGTLAIRLRPNLSGVSADAPTSSARKVARGFAAVLATTCAVAIVADMVNLRIQAIVSHRPTASIAAVLGAIPAHGCVLSTNQSVAILDNRFTADVRGCSPVIDWLGEERVLDHGHSQLGSDKHALALQRLWLRSIQASVALVVRNYPEWDGAVTSYVRVDFRKLSGNHHGFAVFVRDRGTAQLYVTGRALRSIRPT